MIEKNVNDKMKN